MKLRPYPGSSCFAYWVVASFGVCQPWGGESGRVQSNPTHFRQDNVCCKWNIVVASCSLFFSQRHQNICPWGISVFQHAQHGLHEPFNIRGCPPKNHSNSAAYFMVPPYEKRQHIIQDSKATVCGVSSTVQHLTLQCLKHLPNHHLKLTCSSKLAWLNINTSFYQPVASSVLENCPTN